MVQPGNVYKVSFPRSDLAVRIDDVQLRPGLALGSWAAFLQLAQDAMVMGDLVLISGHFVLLASEVNSVIGELRAGGVDITALHSHMLAEQPRLFFMHFWANDNALNLARTLRAALDRTNQRR